jgi:hypothetical protein
VTISLLSKDDFGAGYIVECLPNMHKVLGSIHRTKEGEGEKK